MPEHADNGGGWCRSRWRIAAWSAAALMLLPLFAMQFTDEVNWGAADFAIFGAMLASAGCIYEFAARTTGNRAYRAATGIAVVTAFMLIWMTLAVGVIGSEDNRANLMYGGVLAAGMIGAILARFQSHGMARAMVAMALTQALVAVIALIAGWGPTGASWPGDIVFLTGFFTTLWLLSAWLFRKSSTGQTSAGGVP